MYEADSEFTYFVMWCLRKAIARNRGTNDLKRDVLRASCLHDEEKDATELIKRTRSAMYHHQRYATCSFRQVLGFHMDIMDINTLKFRQK